MGDPRTFQFSFDKGALQITAPLGSMRIRWKPEPHAEEQVSGRPWMESWPEIRLLKPESDFIPTEDPVLQSKQNAFRSLRAEIPDELARQAEMFHSHQWKLLWAMHQRREILELAQSTPVIAYCLANNDLMRGTDHRVANEQAIWYGYRKQTVILEWLGFPATRGTVKLLRKIDLPTVSPYELRMLACALTHQPDLGPLLAHQPRINGGIIHLVTNPDLRRWVTPSLLKAMAESDDQAQTARIAELLVEIKELRHHLGEDGHVPQFRSPARIQDFRDALALRLEVKRQEAERLRIEEQERRQRRRQRQLLRARVAAELRENQARAHRNGPRIDIFPAPPYPGTDDIVPIRTRADLQAESAMMHHCVSTYAERVIAGRCYIYRILRPDRATLSLERIGRDLWTRGEFRGPCNGRVPNGTLKAVDEWIARNSQSL